MEEVSKRVFLHVICFTKAGFSLAGKLTHTVPELVKSVNFCSKDRDCIPHKECIPLDEWVKKNFEQGNILLFIGACGIAVRAIAPYIHHKNVDAGVIVMDEKGQFVISVLSGHIGCANEWTLKIAGAIGGTPVITTATDVNNLFAVDVFARKNNLAIKDLGQVKKFSSALLDEKKCFILIDDSEFFKGLITCDEKDIPSEIKVFYSDKEVLDANYVRAKATCIVSPYEEPEQKDFSIHLIPKNLVVGIGCRKGKSYEQIKEFLENVFLNYNLSMHAISAIASIDIKKNEAGIVKLSEKLSVPFMTFSAQELNEVSEDCSSSAFVKNITGTDNVCERSAYAAGCEKLIVSKTVCNGMTLCIGLRNFVCKFD
ncbi:MAG: cobalt-precorrin 5A hydrolase [Treponema sp.]|nr:cobalt-precorrin 5A hydrolase [Treponema sp.]